MNKDTQGWSFAKDLKWLCEDCQWVLEDGHLCSCEYGETNFPCARACRQFKHEDDE